MLMIHAYPLAMKILAYSLAAKISKATGSYMRATIMLTGELRNFLNLVNLALICFVYFLIIRRTQK